jgi:hypothetical protein
VHVQARLEAISRTRENCCRLLATDDGPTIGCQHHLYIDARDRSAPDDNLRGAYYWVLDSVPGVPGVVHADASRDLPLRGNGETLSQGSTTATGQEAPTTRRHHVSTEFFEALVCPCGPDTRSA